MSRNTRSLEKSGFLRFVHLSLTRPLSERELKEAGIAYERYVGCVQRLLLPGKFSPADTLHALASARMRLVCIRDGTVKVPAELSPLLEAAIKMTEFEMRMVYLRVTHPSVISCSEESRIPKSPLYLAEPFTPTDLMEIATAMQGLGVGRCSDGSTASVEMFAEGFAWLFNVRIKNPGQCRYALLNRKLRLTRFLDRLRGYLIDRSRQ